MTMLNVFKRKVKRLSTINLLGYTVNIKYGGYKKMFEAFKDSKYANLELFLEAEGFIDEDNT